MKKEHSRSNKELLETKYVVAESSESLEIKINEYPQKQGKKIKLEIRRKKKKNMTVRWPVQEIQHLLEVPERDHGIESRRKPTVSQFYDPSYS